MLDAAGGTNVFADVQRQSLQATTEMVIARAPEVIVEIGADTASVEDPQPRCVELDRFRARRPE